MRRVPFLFFLMIFTTGSIATDSVCSRLIHGLGRIAASGVVAGIIAAGVGVVRIEERIDQRRLEARRWVLTTTERNPAPKSAREYFSGIRKRLTDVVESPNALTVRLYSSVDGPSVEASGVIGISLGDSRKMKYEAEVAALTAHEIAHAVRGHDLESARLRKNFLSYAWGSFTRSHKTVRTHLREMVYRQEYEADRLSLKLLEDAGYSPAAAVSALMRIGTLDGDAGRYRFEFDSDTATQPSIVNRIRALEPHLPKKVSIRYVLGPNDRVVDIEIVIPDQDRWVELSAGVWDR